MSSIGYSWNIRWYYQNEKKCKIFFERNFEKANYAVVLSSMTRRLTRVQLFEPKTRTTVRRDSIVLPPRPIIEPISAGSTRRERRVQSSSCFSVISIAAILSTSDSIIYWRKSFAVIDEWSEKIERSKVILTNFENSPEFEGKSIISY